MQGVLVIYYTMQRESTRDVFYRIVKHFIDLCLFSSFSIYNHDKNYIPLAELAK